MTPSARLSAAIEVFADIEARRRPAADALKDWGLSHRFAGSSDRAAIAGLVYDALRRKSSSAWLMGEANPRAVLIGMLHRERGLDVAAIEALCNGARYAPAPLTDAETAGARARILSSVRPRILRATIRIGSIPTWRALSARSGPPKAPRSPAGRRSICASTRLPPSATKCCRNSRILMSNRRAGRPSGFASGSSADAKSPAIHAEPLFLKGQIEIQDEGSQLAALLAGAKPGEQVIDLCAGAGGKTLALAAAMENRGQIYATDTDKRRLVAIHERLARSAARNVQVRTPKSVGDAIADLAGRADLVLIDAPCTGTGTWRRNPDAKWRIRPGALNERIKQQEAALERAAALVKPGGRIAYVTCSVLAEENGDQVRAFTGRHGDFSVEKPANVINVLGERAYLFARAVLISDEGLLMTPRRTDTDGFFVSVLRRSA